MGTQQIGLRDVSSGRRQSRARLLAPLRYLYIYHPEKTRYDFVIPGIISVIVWAVYILINPKPALFGDDGLLRFVRDFLIMGVPFLFSALAAVAMGTPGDHLNRRPTGVELYLDGRLLSLRSFVCYQLGYLSFLGLTTLASSVVAGLMHHAVVIWTHSYPVVQQVVFSIGSLTLFTMLAFFSVTVFWSLYFLTDVVNRN